MPKLLQTEKVGSCYYVENGQTIHVGGEQLQTSASGYGGRIRTGYKTEIPVKNSRGMVHMKLYRVYLMCYSNCSTAYIESKGKCYILRNSL